jgi:hypothetical protein
MFENSTTGEKVITGATPAAATEAARIDSEASLYGAADPALAAGVAQAQAQAQAEEQARMTAQAGGASGYSAPEAQASQAPPPVAPAAPAAGGAPGATPAAAAPVDDRSTGAEGAPSAEQVPAAPQATVGVSAPSGPTTPAAPSGAVRFAGQGTGGGAADPYSLGAALAMRAALAPAAGGGGPVRTVKRQTGETVAIQGAPSPETLEAQQVAARAAGDAKLLALEAEQDKRERAARWMGVGAQIEKNHDERIQQERERQARKLEDVDRLEQQKREEIESISLDPAKFWSSKTTGDQIWAAIGMALGAFGAAMRGDSTNQAMAVVNAALERDLEFKRGTIEKKKGELSELHKYRDAVKARTGDDIAAKLEAKAMGLRQFQLQTEKTALENGSKEAVAQAMALRAQTDREIADLRAQAESRITQQRTYGFAQVGGGGGGPSMKQRLEMLEKAGELQAKAGGRRDGFFAGDKFIPFREGMSEPEKIAVRKQAAAGNNARSSLDAMNKMRGTGIAAGDSDFRAAMQDFTFNYAMSTGQGQATKDNEESVADKVRGVGGEKAINSYRQRIDSSQDELIVQYGRK